MKDPSAQLAYGGWLPKDPDVQAEFIDDVRSKGTLSLHPAVAAFENAMDSEMKVLWGQISQQAVPEAEIESFADFLEAINTIISEPPSFRSFDKDGKKTNIPIGVPMYLLFDLLGNTSAAYDLFRKPAFNAAMKDLLNHWGEYLQSPDSKKTLNETDNGWFGKASLEILESQERGAFEDTYDCPDSTKPDRGFASWDAFFTRKFLSHSRPIEAPDNPDVIHSACESTVFRIAENVKLHDRFWLKSQAYSLYDMLAGDIEMANRFAGGSIHQAFLSPQDYHRWHSPVKGGIVKGVVVDGSYFAALLDAGSPGGHNWNETSDVPNSEARGALFYSQAWLTITSARAIIYIEAKNIGLVAFIGVGMAEVSTCDVAVTDGQDVEVGEELGMFHFGGSSYVTIVGPQSNVKFTADLLGKHVKVNKVIGAVNK